MSKWARLSGSGNGVVQETTASDPTGKFNPNITWIEVTIANSPGGNINVVVPRYTYEPNLFSAPSYPTLPVTLQSSADFIELVNFTGSGSWNWTTIGSVNIVATATTSHFVSFSSNLFSPNLVVGGGSTTPPDGTGSGGQDYYTPGQEGGSKGGTNNNG